MKCKLIILLILVFGSINAVNYSSTFKKLPLSPNVKVVVYSPIENADDVREAIGRAGAGKFDNYDFCSTSNVVTGYWRANEGANPAIGEIGELESAVEEQISFVCPYEILEDVIEAAQKVHPYEVMGFDVYPMIDMPMTKKKDETKK